MQIRDPGVAVHAAGKSTDEILWTKNVGQIYGRNLMDESLRTNLRTKSYGRNLTAMSFAPLPAALLTVQNVDG